MRNDEQANKPTEPKRPWEPITLKVYHARDAEFGAGAFPDGTSIGSSPS